MMKKQRPTLSASLVAQPGAAQPATDDTPAPPERKAAAPVAVSAPAPSGKPINFTIRFNPGSETEWRTYEALRLFTARTRRSGQDVALAALAEYLERQG